MSRLARTLSSDTGYSVECPQLLRDREDHVWVVSACLHGDDARVGVRPLSAETSDPIVIHRGCFHSSPRAVSLDSGDICVVFTEAQGGLRKVVLGGVHRGLPKGAVDVTNGFGRYDSPSLAVHGHDLWLCWDAYQGGDCCIEAKQYSLSDSGHIVDESPARRLSPTGARSYKPMFIHDAAGTLYLIYESFYDRRYHLLLQHSSSSGCAFSEPIEIGFSEGNDQAASVCRCNGGIAVAWENSRPLERNYVYPLFPDITIPAFGHGWRIDTRTGLRRVAFQNGVLSTETLGGNGPEVELDGHQSSGCPSLAAGHNGEIALTYVSFCNESWNWKIHARQLDGVHWKEIGSIGAPLPQRIPASCAFDGSGRLLVGSMHESADGRLLQVSSFEPETCEPAKFGAELECPMPVSVRSDRAPRYSIAYGGEEMGLWWGDLHMHSNVSICSNHYGFHCTELEEKYRFSRDVGELDFAMVTDHDGMSDHEWERTIRAAQSANMPGEFVAFLGYEWTSSMIADRKTYGHRKVLFVSDDGVLVRCTVPGGESPEELWESLAGFECLTIPHHTSCAMHTFDWDYHNPVVEPLAEIFQVRGSYEYDDCPKWPTNYGRETVAGHSIQEGLRRGYKLGFTSGGEHEGVGITAVYAKELDRRAIFDALKARRVYGTTGARMILDFRVNGSLMGEEAAESREPVVQISVQGTDRIESIRLVRDGHTANEWTGLGDHATLNWIDSARSGLAVGDHYYYCVISQADGEMAWSSPVFCRIK